MRDLFQYPGKLFIFISSKTTMIRSRDKLIIQRVTYIKYVHIRIAHFGVISCKLLTYDSIPRNGRNGRSHAQFHQH